MLARIQKYKWEYLILAAVLLFAFWIRIVNIDGTPGGVYPDEAVNGMDAYKTYAGIQPFQWFYPDNNGREGLYINLIALTYRVFGVTILGLKFWSIMFGVLTVLGTYLLAVELFKSRRVALVAAFMVAASFWSINFSRIAFRAIMLAPVLLFSVYSLFVGLRTQKYLPFLVGGFIFGLGLHTYIAFRIAPVTLIALFIAAWISRPHFIRTYWSRALLFLAFSLISAAPMLWTFYEHPEFLSSRTGDVSVFSPEVNGGHLFATLAKSIGLTAIQYNFVGDMNWRHNYPPYPLLHPVIGVAFLVGLCMLLKRFFHLLSTRVKHKKQDTQFEVATLLLAWLVLMHAPEFLTAEGLPHALRAIGALPAVYLIAAWPFTWILSENRLKKSAFARIGTYSFVVSVLIFVGAFNAIKYHVFWANEPQQYRAFQSNLMEIARYVQSLPQNTPVYLVTGSMERIPVKLFNAERGNLTDLYPQQGLEITYPAGSVVILTEKNDELIKLLRSQAGCGGTAIVQTMESPIGDPFYVIMR